MKIEIDGQELNVIITRKKKLKRMYLRVKEDFNIYISANVFTKDKDIINFINQNKNFIIKNLKLRKKQNEYEKDFYYLGKKYDLVYLNNKDIIIGDRKVFIDKKIDLNKWLKKQSLLIFQEELNKIYKDFPCKIDKPTLTIRNMKTRWGVCNVKTKRITLNLSLIKKDIKYLDYVIVHELSHLIYPNHSKDFWNLVGIIEPNYKKIRKELNSYE